MNITLFSFISATIWFNLCMIFVALMRRRVSFMIHFTLIPLIFLIIIGILRLLLPLEFFFTIPIGSTHVLPYLVSIMDYSVFSVSKNTAFTICNILATVWALGTLYYLTKYIIQLSSLFRVIHKMSSNPTAQMLSCMEKILKENKRAIKSKIIQTSEISTPIIIGFFSPTICLPKIKFTDEELEHILRHEYSHFLHGDSWVKLCIYIIRSIFWWNPFIYLLQNDLDHILEMQCDIRVTSQMYEQERIHYLQSIVKVMKAKKDINTNSELPYSIVASTFFSTQNKKKVIQRFYLILNQKTKLPGYQISMYLLCFAILLSFVFSYSFVVQAAYYPNDTSFTITQENAYLQKSINNTYSLYINDNYICDLDTISNEPFCSLPIYH